MSRSTGVASNDKRHEPFSPQEVVKKGDRKEERKRGESQREMEREGERERERERRKEGSVETNIIMIRPLPHPNPLPSFAFHPLRETCAPSLDTSSLGIRHCLKPRLDGNSYHVDGAIKFKNPLRNRHFTSQRAPLLTTGFLKISPHLGGCSGSCVHLGHNHVFSAGENHVLNAILSVTCWSVMYFILAFNRFPSHPIIHF